ncbi:MAG: 2-(3-amino-3-carboxypropyl)histidine synthase subunit 1/2, partial [Candidatus Micrarchaeota archaeon]
EYIEYPMKVNYARALKKALALLTNYRKVGLVTTVQHVGQLAEIKKFLERNWKKVLIGRGKRAKYEGQILGCDFEAAASVARDVDCFVYFGGGAFHPLGMRVHKPVLAVDPFSGGALWMDEEIKKLEKRRKFSMMRAAEARTFGILVSTKIGQLALARAQKIKKIMEGKGRRAVILVSSEINPEALKNFRAFECYINTACPRIADDYESFDHPVINYEDAIALTRMLR